MSSSLMTPIRAGTGGLLLRNNLYTLVYKSEKLQVLDLDSVVPPNGEKFVPGAKSPFELTSDAAGVKFGGVVIATYPVGVISEFVSCQITIDANGMVKAVGTFKYLKDIVGVGVNVKAGTTYTKEAVLIRPNPQLGTIITSFSALGTGKLLPVPGAGTVLTTTGDYSIVTSSTGIVVQRKSDSTIGWRATCKYIYIDPKGNLWFTSTKYSLPTQMVNWGKPQTGTASSARLTLDANGKLNLFVGSRQVYQSTLETVQDCVVSWGACTSGKQTATITKNPTGFGAKQCPPSPQNCNDCVDATPSPGMCINGKNEVKYAGFKAASADSTKKNCKNNDTLTGQPCTEGLDGVDDTIETYKSLVDTIKAMGPASSSLVSSVDAAWTKLKATQSLADQAKFITEVKAFIAGFKATLPPDTPGRAQLQDTKLTTAADLAGFLGSMNAFKSIGAAPGGSQGLGAVSGGSGSLGAVSGGSQGLGVTPINCVGAWSDCVNGSQKYAVTTPASEGGLACPAVAGDTKTCGTPCEGTWSDWAACTNGKQTQVYNVTKQPSGGGKECPPLTNTRDCGTACVGNWTPWGACNPTTGKQSRTYLVATQASGGGLACPSPLTETQSCAVDCVGAWDSDWSECVDGSQTKMYTITTEAFGGGAACSDKAGDKKTQKCESEAPKEVVETPVELVAEEEGSNIWLYVGGGVLLLIVLIIVAFMVLRKKK